MSESGVRSSWLTLATNSSRVRSSCLSRVKIVKDENRAFALAGGIGDDGGVDPQPAPAQFRQLQFVIKNLSLGLDARDQFSQFVQAQRLHDRLAAQLGFQTRTGS